MADTRIAGRLAVNFLSWQHTNYCRNPDRTRAAARRCRRLSFIGSATYWRMPMRRCLTALFGVIGCLAVSLAATQASAERRVALVVGNAAYAHTAALPNPRNDAED